MIQEQSENRIKLTSSFVDEFYFCFIEIVKTEFLERTWYTGCEKYFMEIELKIQFAVKILNYRTILMGESTHL